MNAKPHELPDEADAEAEETEETTILPWMVIQPTDSGELRCRTGWLDDAGDWLDLRVDTVVPPERADVAAGLAIQEYIALNGVAQAATAEAEGE